MFRERNTADQIWEAMEFRDLQDEVTGPTMTGDSNCSNLGCTGRECYTNVGGCRSQTCTQSYCVTQVGCPAPGKRNR